MGIKNLLASLGFASMAPFAKADQTLDIVRANNDIQQQITNMLMPGWIATTSDGQFDKTKAYKEAKIFWKKNGKDIQQFADEVKAGVDEQIAFQKVVNKLAKGDQKKEKELLDLYGVITKTLAKKNGHVKDTHKDKMAAIGTNALLGCVLAMMGAMIGWPALRYGEKFSVKKTLKYTSILTSPVILISVFNAAFPLYTTSSETFMTEKIFVDIQERIYNEYKKQGLKSKKQYTMTDLKTTKKILEMEKKR